MQPAVADPPPARSGRRPLAAPRLGPGERRTLAGATWADYVRLSADSGRTKIKYTFDGPAGLLEIEMPQGHPHESISRLLFWLIVSYAERRDTELAPSGSVTVRREDVTRGAEPDESFYVTHLADFPPPGTNLLDLEGGQRPPDLVIEVDVTSPGVSKLPIYAALGIPEVWVWADEEIVCRRLTGAGAYAVRHDSDELPGFPFELAADLVSRRPWGLIALKRAFLAGLRVNG